MTTGMGMTTGSWMARPGAMTEEEYLLLNEFISGRFGITFPEHKRDLLESRLRPVSRRSISNAISITIYSWSVTARASGSTWRSW